MKQLAHTSSQTAKLEKELKKRGARWVRKSGTIAINQAALETSSHLRNEHKETHTWEQSQRCRQRSDLRSSARQKRRSPPILPGPSPESVRTHAGGNLVEADTTNGATHDSSHARPSQCPYVSQVGKAKGLEAEGPRRLQSVSGRSRHGIVLPSRVECGTTHAIDVTRPTKPLQNTKKTTFQHPPRDTTLLPASFNPSPPPPLLFFFPTPTISTRENGIHAIKRKNCCRRIPPFEIRSRSP